MKQNINQLDAHVSPILQFSEKLNAENQQDLANQKGTGTIKKETDYIFDISNGLDKKTKEMIENTVDTHQYHKNSYFFDPAANARGRRAKEASFFENNPDYSLVDGNDKIEVTFYYRQTCKNVYYRLSITFNDQKKDIRLLKRLLKEK